MCLTTHRRRSRGGDRQPLKNLEQQIDLIWSLANLLRHYYKPHEYADVILPLVVLRRLDQAMEPTPAVIRQAYETYKGKLDNQDSVLTAKARGRWFTPIPNSTGSAC